MELSEKSFNKLNKSIFLLKEIKDSTDNYYGIISDRLPVVEEEIEESIKNIETASSKITKVLMDFRDEVGKLYESLSDTDELLEGLEGFIIKKNQNSQTHFNIIFKLIKELKGVLTQLKVLSINANILSFNSNIEESGLQVITSEISANSERAKNKYEKIEINITKLQQWYQNFKSNIDCMVSEEERLTKDYKSKLELYFNQLFDELEKMEVQVGKLLDRLENAVEPVYNVLVLIQEQDIIRQNIDNLIEILLEIKTRFNNFGSLEDYKEKLNFIIFIEESLNLSRKLMINILKQLDESLFSIQDYFAKMQSDLRELNEEVDIIYQEAKVQDNYHEINKFIPDFLEAVNKNKVQYEEIIKDKKDFSKNMEGIEAGFKEINILAENFTKIKTLAKIEFARMENENRFIDDIVKVIDDFVEISDENQNANQLLIEELSKRLNNFEDLARNNYDCFADIQKVLFSSEKTLNDINMTFNDTQKDIKTTIEGLISEINYNNQQILNCQQLNNKGQDLIDNIKLILKDIKEAKDYYLIELDQKNWQGDNQHLKELINKFTSYLERKTANDELEELDIDIGQKSGEMILF